MSKEAVQGSLFPLKLAAPDPASNIPYDADWLTIPVADFPRAKSAVTSDDLGLDPDPFYTKGFPMGSIFYNYSEEKASEDRRRRNKRCPEDATAYYSRSRHFREIQERRMFVPPNAFYELLRKNALKAEDFER